MGSVRHGYFTIQVKAVRIAGQVWLSGVVENLGTGDKSAFQTADGLLEVVRAWSSGVTEATDASSPTKERS